MGQVAEKAPPYEGVAEATASRSFTSEKCLALVLGQALPARGMTSQSFAPVVVRSLRGGYQDRGWLLSKRPLALLNIPVGQLMASTSNTQVAGRKVRQ